MEKWDAPSLVFFAYVIAVAIRMPHLQRGRRLLACGGAATAIVIVLANAAFLRYPITDAWVVPPLLLLVAYWTTGLLFVAPMRRAEAALGAIDRLLRVRSVAAAAPRALAELLELAYAGVYPIIPVALALHLLFGAHPSPGRFWTVVLVTDYVCFGFLPWVQTRAPRSLEPEPPWGARFRTVNLRLLGSASIGVNTFPSGHAAEALAAALLVADAPSPAFVLMLAAAAAISAGAVLGRYHYAADAITGWAVGIIVTFAIR